MYPKHAVSLLNQQFWTAFGKYMAPVLSTEGEKINWINYKAGIKFIRFNMEAANNKASIAIEFLHPDKATQQQQFNQLGNFKIQFEKTCGPSWQWQKLIIDEQGKTISRIVKELNNASILNQDDWPKIISFLKPSLISLDNFWSHYKFALEA
ncbi:MAG: DUF4268 domain-containing protein [Ferruginibacter sp.]|nr:DUF4268 domain-containing protein [Ferruginibacter sp.]